MEKTWRMGGMGSEWVVPRGGKLKFECVKLGVLRGILGNMASD